MSRLRLRRRRRVARAIARAHGLRSAARREWRWALRDIRDLRLELKLRCDEARGRRRTAAALVEAAGMQYGPDFEIEPMRRPT